MLVNVDYLQFLSSSSGITVRGEPSKIVLHCSRSATYIFNSSRQCSWDLPQLIQATSTEVFLHVDQLLA